MKPWRVHRTGCPLSAGDELLLRAALLEKDEALAAWRQWKQGVDLDALDVNASRLLPLLYANLRRHEVSDPLMERLQGVYRYNALRNQGFLRDLNGALRVLAEQGIPVMVLKGMALAVGCYGDLALRPMQDMDLLVKPEDVIKAMQALIAAGWAPKEREGGPFNATRLAGVGEYSFLNSHGARIDLHWGAKQKEDPATLRSYWEQAVELEALDAPFWAMDPADAMFYALAHGIKHRAANAPRMMADLHTIVLKAGERIAWERLAGRIEVNGLILTARDVFAYSHQLLGTPIPVPFTRRLAGFVPPGRDWLVHHAVNRSPQKARFLLFSALNLAGDYLGEKEQMRRQGRGLSALRYLRGRWGLREMGQVPSTLLGKVWAHLRRELGSPGSRRE